MDLPTQPIILNLNLDHGFHDSSDCISSMVMKWKQKKRKKNNLEINSYDVLNTELKNKEIIQLLE